MPYRRWNPGCPCCVVSTVATPNPITWRPRGRTFTLHDNCYGQHTYEEWQNATVTLTIASGGTYFGWANGTRILPLFSNSVGGILNKYYNTLFQSTSGVTSNSFTWTFNSYIGVASVAPPACEITLARHGVTIGVGFANWNASFVPNCTMLYNFRNDSDNTSGSLAPPESVVDAEASGLLVNLSVVF